MLGYSSSGRICPEINLHVSDAGLNVSISGSITLEGSIATWMLACAGDILDASYFTDGPIFAYRDLEGRGGTMTAVSKDSAFYLGVKVEELTSDWPEDWDGNWSDTRLYTGKYDYAWVMLDVDADGRLSLRSSALDLDGGPMIVGGGSAIPEPSGGLLFLLGGAALALRRRKRTPVGAFLTSRDDGPGRAGQRDRRMACMARARRQKRGVRV